MWQEPTEEDLLPIRTLQDENDIARYDTNYLKPCDCGWLRNKFSYDFITSEFYIGCFCDVKQVRVDCDKNNPKEGLAKVKELWNNRNE